MRKLRVAAFGLLALAAASAASAGGFSLSPLRLSIPARESSNSVVAENTGGTPIVIQVRPLQWTQRDGKDERAETRDLVVNPPIFRLAPGEQQLVRVASRLGPPASDERAYRVVFTEIPPNDAPQTQPGLRFAVAMDIPVFIEPVTPTVPQPAQWRAERTADGLRVRVDNPGHAHYRINDVQFGTADGKVLHKLPFVVVLPYAWLAWDIQVPTRGVSSIRLSADGSDNRKVTVDIPLAAAP
jgi:fimbrial chaperone protein